MSSYISKSYRSLNLQQSPKISSKKFRRNIAINLPENNERLFSLRDIDLKKTNQRGTELPIQYQRRNDNELKQIINGKGYNSFRNQNTPVKAFKRNFPSFDYVKKIKENPFAFRKVRELCSDYIESYCQGKSILSKPFGKENMIK